MKLPWRIAVVLLAPVWIPTLACLVIVWFCLAALFWFFGGVGYWLATGDDILQTKYNVFGI